MENLLTVKDLLLSIEKNYQNPNALVSNIEEQWIPISTQEMLSQIRWVALALLELGVAKGEKVGILALPNARWTIVDLAIMAIGAVSVPIFANISPDNFLYEVKQTEIKTVFVGGSEQWHRCEIHRDLFTHLISLDDVPGIPNAISYGSCLKSGADFGDEHPLLYEETLNQIQPLDVATIIYTSGSTGVPKGAEHTHQSLFSLLMTDMFDWNSTSDRFLSFLPLAHVFARVFNLIMIAWGISTYYYNDIKKIGTACQDVKPTIMIVVPRVLEKMYAKMYTQVHASTGLKRLIGEWAFRLADRTSFSLWQRMILPFADHLVYSKLRRALGGNLRVVISGGAALSPKLNYFLRNAGFPIFEGWGLTESCPVTVNQFGMNKIGTIGRPIPGMIVKTTPEGELLVSGIMKMKGYYRNPEATREALDQAGWLHTGDKGFIDSEGYVTIVGRLKELLKTSTGEVIAPIPIEQALCKSPLIEMAIVIADNRKFVSCLLVPNFETLKVTKIKKQLTHISDEDFLKTPVIRNEVEQALSHINEHLNHWEKIRDFRFIPHALTVEADELTPSMKLRRGMIEKKYKDLIDSMYVEDPHE